MTTQKNEYSAKSIKTPTQREHVRHRVGMYLGSNSDEGMTVAVRELADNSIDEVLAGHGNCVNLTFHADGSAEVQDYGRGLPIDKNEAGVNGIILTLGTIGSGGKFNSDNYAASGGLNGVGASAAIATSRGALVTVYRDGNMYKLGFKEGLPGFFTDETNPDSKFTESKELKVSKDPRSVAEKKKNPTGTSVRIWPDFSVFLPGSKFLVEDIKFRMRSTAFLVAGLIIKVDDLRDPSNPVSDVYDFPGGIQDMLPTLTNYPFVTKPIHIKTEGSFDEVATVMDSNGKMSQAQVTRNVNIETTFAYTGDEDMMLKSYVNIINTKNGGTHESGLWRALSRVLINYAKSVRGLLKKTDEVPTLEDVKDGFIGVLSISFPEPTFTGQAKEGLDTKQITSVVSQAVGNDLKLWLENKKNETQAKLIAKRIVDAAQIRAAARNQKDVARKKSALETSTSLPSKLVECADVGDEFSELHICEGDSALGTMKSARDSSKQALFPIRGKILNVQKATAAAMLANAECADLIQIIGAGSGKNFDVEQMRYHNICIAVDADLDGNHIRTLLITYFWKYMRPLVEAGRLYATMPPLYVVKTTGRDKKIFYVDSDAERDALVDDLKKKKISHSQPQRFKGLGEMDAEEFWETTLNPETRSLRRVTVTDAVAAGEMLELAMGNKVEPRKDWIMESRRQIADDDLDI